MIKKILAISTVGRFEKYSATGDVEFKKLTTLFAENGKGKTTLSAIFRSLKDNNPIYISERLTLGSQEKQEVKIITDNSNHIFNNNWDTSYPDIEIFDSAFINNNVFSGEYVEHGHKKNLYHFVIGEKGVVLALKVDTLDEQIRNINNKITAQKLEIQKFIVGNSLSIDSFIELQKIENINELIQKKYEEIEAIKKAAIITNRPILQKMYWPDYPKQNIEEILQTSIAKISKDAEYKTKEHIKLHLDTNGENWLQQGLMYINEHCPFCGQSLDSTDLIEAYQNYFNIEYKQLKNSITVALQDFKKVFSETALSYIQQGDSSNQTTLAFWKEYLTIPELFNLQINTLKKYWEELSTLTTDQLNIKNSSPLDKIAINKKLDEAISNYAKLKSNLGTFNEQVEQINELIQKKKLTAGSGNLQNSQQELETLQNTQIRYDEKIIQFCDQYQILLKEKQLSEKDKIIAKQELGQYTENVFKLYQARINDYLKNFGAGFEITETKTDFTGGKPSSGYRISINNTSIDVSEKASGKPSFSNMLSQGDKNTLAFSFFLARLDQDEKLNQKTIIFDDPISSLDGHRKDCTEQEIIKISQKSAQCLIMSHDKYFLRSIWDKGLNIDVKSLQIVRASNGSDIIKWDIQSDTMGAYFEDYYTLLKYKDNGATTDKERRSIARCIRPVLEGYLRIKFPEDFKPNKWLGEFINNLTSNTNNNVANFKNSQLTNIKEINDYSKKYHHKDNPNADSEGINDNELLVFINRTLTLINN